MHALNKVYDAQVYCQYCQIYFCIVKTNNTKINNKNQQKTVKNVQLFKDLSC